MHFCREIYKEGIKDGMLLITAKNILLTIETDPMEIIKKYDYIGSSNMASSAYYNSPYYLFDFGGLFRLVRDNFLIVGTIGTLLCLMSMLFIKQSTQLAEKKKELMNKIFIVFIGMSAPTLFSWMKVLFGTLMI